MKKLLGYIKIIYKKGLLHILTGSFLTKLVAFFGSVFLVRALSKQEFGILGYMENIYGYVLVLAGMGMSNAIIRYVVLGQTDAEKYGYYRYCIQKSVLWNLILGLIAGVFFAFYPHPGMYKPYLWLLDVMFLMLPFQYLTDNLLCTDQAMFANQRFARFSLLLSASVIFGKALFGYLGGIVWAVIAQMCVYAVLAVVMLISAHKKYFKGIVPAVLTRNEKRRVNKYALQYMITNGLWAVFMLNDTFLLGRFSDPAVLAEYKVSYTIPGCVNLISTAIGIFVVPYFVRNEDNRGWVQSKFKLIYGLNAGAVGIICIGIAALAKPIVWILYGEQYLNIVPIMRLLLLAAFFNCGMRYTCANLLAAMGQVKYNMIVSAIAIVLQVAINLAVIPRYGAMGVAATSCIIYLFMAIALLAVFLWRYFRKN